jgi:hypothetical protein
MDTLLTLVMMKITTRGESGDPRGNEMESEKMRVKTPIGQVRKWKMAWVRVLLVRVGFQSEVYLQKSIIPARDKTKWRYTSQNIKWTSK